MKTIEKKSVFNDLIVISIIAEIFSIFTLWLVESPIKYFLFVFETISIIVTYVILRNYDFSFRSLTILKIIPSGVILDLALIYSSILLIFASSLDLENITQFFLAFFPVAVLSGYAILNIFNLTKHFSKLEILILSFIVSFFFSGISMILHQWTNEFLMTIILVPSIFISLGIFSTIRHIKNKKESISSQKSFSKRIDLIPLILCIIFYIMFYYYVYPNFSLLVGSDISRIYNYSILLERSPELYTSFTYFLLNSFYSIFNILSNFPPITFFHTALVTLNILLPLAIYAFTKRFFSSLDNRIPIITTLLYVLVSNFSFIDFSQLKIIGTHDDLFQMIGTVAQNSYFGSIYSLQPFVWFGGQSISLIMLVMAFLLLSVKNIPRPHFIILFAVLILAMYLTHTAESLIFVIFISAYSIISKTKTLRINDVLLSSLIAITISTLFLVYTSIFWESDLRLSEINFVRLFPLIFSILAISFSLFWRKKIYSKIHFPKKSVNLKRIYPVISIILTSTYLIGLLTWFFIDDQNYLFLYSIGVVPWFIYPLLLGIVGLLSLLTIRYFNEILPNSYVSLILGLILFLLLFGQLISFFNINVFDTGFWEKRILSYLLVGISIVGSIGMIKFFDNLNFRKKLFNKISYSLVISMIIFLGFSTTALQFEYWNLKSNEIIEPMELEAVNYLRNILQDDPRSFVLSPSTPSRHALYFASPAYQLPLPEISMSSKYPEIPLFLLGAHHLPHGYIFMHNRDFDLLKDEDSWIVNHLIPMLPVIFSNEEVTIYNATQVSYPQQISETTLIIPFESETSYKRASLHTYDIVSQGDYNFTAMYDIDPKALSSKTVVLSYDPPINDNFSYFDELYSSENWRTISGNWIFSDHGLLHGCNTKSDTGNVILSPIDSENFTVSTSFKMLSADPEIANRASIVHSWNSSIDYELASFTLYKEKVYVSFITVNKNEGKDTIEPDWPGVETDLSWKSGDALNMTLSTQKKSIQLFLNGTKYLEKDHVNKLGHIGFECNGIHNLEFDFLKINDPRKFDLRKTSDYFEYAQSGGNLVVINGNGRGIIFNYIFKEGPPIEVNKITIPALGALPVDITMTQALQTSKNTESFMWYNSSDTNSSVLLAKKSIGNGNITYLDIHPILSSMYNNKMNAPQVYKILGMANELLGIDKNESSSSINDIKVYFRELFGIGKIQINSASFLFPEPIRHTEITLDKHAQEILIANVTNLTIVGKHDVPLTGDQIIISNGNGLYADMELSNPVGYFLDYATITGTSNTNLFHFENVSKIVIRNNDPIHILAKQPTIYINGNTTMYEPQRSKLSTLPTIERESLQVFGNMSLNLFMSDTYNLAKDVLIEGKTVRAPPLTEVYEIVFLPPQFSISAISSTPVLVGILLLMPFFIAALFLFDKGKKYSNSTI